MVGVKTSVRWREGSEGATVNLPSGWSVSAPGTDAVRHDAVLGLGLSSALLPRKTKALPGRSQTLPRRWSQGHKQNREHGPF